MSNPDQREYDEAVEALRQAFCGLQRYSFHTDGHGGVRRVPDRCGNWVEFQAAHELFDPVMVDAAIAKLRVPLPVSANVYPDGIPGQPGRTGTNLLSALQAKAMLQHVLGG